MQVSLQTDTANRGRENADIRLASMSLRIGLVMLLYTSVWTVHDWGVLLSLKFPARVLILKRAVVDLEHPDSAYCTSSSRYVVSA